MPKPLRPLALTLALCAFALLAAFPAAAAEPAAGTVQLLSSPDRPFRSLQLAVDSAQDDDILRVGPGTFDEALRITGKRLRIVGAGAGRTTLRGPGALITVAADARLRVEDLTVACQPGEGGAGEALAGVYVRGDGFWMSECEVRGAAGFALEVEGAVSDIEVFGSYLHDCGGGILLEKAGARIVGNVVARNRGAALVLGPAPEEESPVVLEHNTLVQNGVAGESVALATRIAPGGKVTTVGRIAFGYNIVSGEVPPRMLVALSRDTFDYANVQLEDFQIDGFFEDDDDGDYRPEEEQKKDAAGLEMGGRLSEDGAEQLRPSIDMALDQGRISEGLFLIRWLPAEDRGPYLNRARSALYSRFVEHVEAKRYGLALRDFFFVQAEAPAEWGVRDRFRVAFRRVLPPYAMRVDWSSTFPDGSSYGAQLALLLESGAARTGRPDTGDEGLPTWTVTAKLEAPLVVKRRRAAVRADLRAVNPDFRSVEEALTIERRRLERADRERTKAAEMLEVAKAQGRKPGSTYYKARARKLDDALERVVAIEDKIRTLEETRKGVRGSFTFTLTGQSESVQVRARALVLLADPAGKKHELSVGLARDERFVRMKPLPALDWPGLPGRQADEAREQERYERLFADKLVSAALNAVETRDLDRLTALLTAVEKRRATDADLSELYELVALYAPRLQGAERGAREIAALREQAAALPEQDEPSFRVVEDHSLDRSPPLAIVAESGVERQRLLARVFEIEHRYALYLGIVDKLQRYFAKLDGRRLEDFLRMALAARG